MQPAIANQKWIARVEPTLLIWMSKGSRIFRTIFHGHEPHQREDQIMSSADFLDIIEDADTPQFVSCLRQRIANIVEVCQGRVGGGLKIGTLRDSENRFSV
jgi:hypothetical protein